MAGPKITAELLMVTDLKDVVEDIGNGLSKAAKQHAREVKKTVGSAWKDAVSMALGSNQTEQAMQAFLKSNITDAAEQYQALMAKGRVAEAQAQKELLSKRAKAFKREVQLRRQAYKEVQDAQMRTAEESADMFKGGAEKVRGMLSGDLFGGAADIGRGAGKYLQKRGRARLGRVEEMRAAGADPKAIANTARMGKMLSGLGAGLAAFAAVAAALLVLVKIFMDIESKAKEMNRTLLESAGAADFGLGHAEAVSGGFHERLDELRGATAALNETFFTFGAQAKEQQQVLNQLNQAGFTFAKMTKGMETAAQRGRAYGDAMAVALTYSRALGVSSSEMAQKMGAFTLETGLNLDEIGKQFSTITQEAMRAGFVTKRFYGIVTEITSGMAFYGVRIEETSKLLSNFSNLLGETLGAEALKGIVGKTAQMGAQDRAREILLKGRGFVGEELREAGERALANLQQQTKVTELLGAKGLDIGEMVRTMTEDQLRLTLERAGVGEQQITQAAQAQRMLRAEQRGMGAMGEAMGFAGPGFEIAMAMQAGEVFQGKDIAQVMEEARMGGDAGIAMQAGLEKVASMTGKPLAQVTELLEQANTKWDALSQIRQRLMEAEGDLTALSAEDRKYLADIEKTMGISIDRQTGAILKDGMVPLEEAMDIVKVTSTADSDKLSEQFTKDQELAMGISENIYGLSEIMEQTIAQILNDIYEVVSAIAREFLKGSDETAALVAVEEAREEREKAEADFARKREAVRDIDIKLRTAEGDEREKLLQERQKALGEQQKAQKRVKRQVVLEKAARTAPKGKVLERQEAALAEEGFIEAGPTGGKYTKQTVEDIFGEKTATASGLRAAYADEDMKVVGALEWIGPEDVIEDMRERWENLDENVKQAFLDRYGADNVERALKAAEAEIRKQAPKIEDEAWTQAAEYEQMRGVGVGKFEAELMKGLGVEEEGPGGFDPLGTVWGIAGKAGDALEHIAENTKKTADETEHVAEATTAEALQGMKPKAVKDTMVFPESGPPLAIDSRDTLFAGMPGGPVDRALQGGGGGGGMVNVYVNGGNTSEVYRQIMRALKATGNA